MARSRDLADSGVVINALDSVTSNVQTQLDGKQEYDLNLTGFVGAFNLPTTDGSNGQVLSTNGAGTLSFVDGSDPNALTSSDIGVTVQPYNANTLTSSDIGVTVQPYNANALTSSDIGVTVQPYNANTLTSSDIGVTVQPYVTGILTESDIGSLVQDYDLNLTDFLTEFTLPITDGTSGQVLQTNGLGTLSFVDVATGSSYGDSDVATYLSTNGYDTSTNIIASLATVATTGSYTDLTNTPPIPSSLTDLGIADGTSGQVLTTNGLGTFTFAEATGGGGGTLGTLIKDFAEDEEATIFLTDSVIVPVVGAIKQIGVSGSQTSTALEVDATTKNYTRKNSAYNTTLSWAPGSFVKATRLAILDVTSEENDPHDIVFNPDGTKMFIVGSSGDEVNAYTLNTGFDISTVSPVVISYSVASQDTNPRGIRFNTDGTKMFICGSTNDRIYEYALSTGFDISTASYTQSLYVGGAPVGLAFNLDGTKMFLIDSSNRRVYEYLLTTGFDISTATFNLFFDTSPDLGLTLPTGLGFNLDGTKMYVLRGDLNNVINIYEYTLSTAFDLSTASYSTGRTCWDSNDRYCNGLAFNLEGDKFFIVGNEVDIIAEYTIPSILQLGTGSFNSSDVGKTIEANSGQFLLKSTEGEYTEVTVPSSYDQVSSGAWQMFSILYNNTNDSLQLSATTTNTYDISTAVYSQELDISILTLPVAISFSTDGTKMFILDQSSDTIQQYALSTGFDISTAVLVSGGGYYVGGFEASPRGLEFSTDGTLMFIVGFNSNVVRKFQLSTPWDISSGVTNVEYYFVGSNVPLGLAFNSTGTRMYVSFNTGDNIRQYNLSAPYSFTGITSASYFVGNQTTTPTELAFSSDGTKMVVSGGGTLFVYNLPAPWELRNNVYTGISITTTGGASGLAFNNDGSKLFVTSSGATDKVLEYNLGNFTSATGYQVAYTTNIELSGDLNSMTVTDAAGDGNAYYAISTDGSITWAIIDNTNGVRNIVRYFGSSTWQYNSSSTYSTETWVNATINTQFDALSESMEVAQNRMDKAQLNAVTDANHFPLNSNIAAAVMLNIAAGVVPPSSEGISTNYEGAVINKSAILGTDYEFEAPTQDSVKIKALAAGSYKIRVV